MIKKWNLVISIRIDEGSTMRGIIETNDGRKLKIDVAARGREYDVDIFREDGTEDDDPELSDYIWEWCRPLEDVLDAAENVMDITDDHTVIGKSTEHGATNVSVTDRDGNFTVVR